MQKDTGGGEASIGRRLGGVWKDSASEAADAAESRPRQRSVAGEAGALANLLLEELCLKSPGWGKVLLRAESTGSVRPETTSWLLANSGSGDNPLPSETSSD